jgi:hypothetical protein
MTKKAYAERAEQRMLVAPILASLLKVTYEFPVGWQQVLNILL